MRRLGMFSRVFWIDDQVQRCSSGSEFATREKGRTRAKQQQLLYLHGVTMNSGGPESPWNSTTLRNMSATPTASPGDIPHVATQDNPTSNTTTTGTSIQNVTDRRLTFHDDEATAVAAAAEEGGKVRGTSQYTAFGSRRSAQQQHGTSPSVVPRLASGVVVNAKNTLQSFSRINLAPTPGNGHQDSDHDFYKHIHGDNDHVPRRARNETAAIAPWATVSPVSKGLAKKMDHDASTSAHAVLTSQQSKQQLPRVAARSPSPMNHDDPLVFASAQFVETAKEASLPIQSLHPDAWANTKPAVPRDTHSDDEETAPPMESSAKRDSKRRRLLLLRLVGATVLLSVVVLAAVCTTTGSCQRGGRSGRDASTSNASEPERVAAFINSITLSGRTIAALAATAPIDGQLPEELALQWLLYEDPLRLVPDTAGDEFRLLQRYALATLAITSHVNDATTNSWWNSTMALDECQWRGIVCRDRNVSEVVGRQSVVTEMHWQGSNLSGRVSSDLGLLRFLELVDMSQNRLSGPFPTTFGLWTNLQFFNVGFNSALSGIIPTTFALWTVLQNFTVSGNALVGTLPRVIQEWVKLEHFDISDNGIVGVLPEAIAEWSNLMHFDAGSNTDSASNRLTGSLPSAVGKWTALKYFRVNWNLLVGSLPETLQQWTLLETFDAYENDLTGSLPDSFGQWSNLRTFHIGENEQLTGSLSESFGNWTDMESFEAQENNLVGKLPDSFGQWTNLRNFSIVRNGLTGSLPNTIGQWTNVESVKFSVNAFTGSFPTVIGQWTNLGTFWASDNKFRGSLPESIGQWSKLIAFNIDRNNVTGSLPESIAQWSDVMRFSVCSNRLTGTIPPWVSNWTSIETVFLELNSFTGVIPNGICGPNLTILAADCMAEVTCNCCTSCNETLKAKYMFDEDDTLLVETGT
jgi:hypothetical protein